MPKLVEGIAELLALRDRHALDPAFAMLVANQMAVAPLSVAIYRRVGDPGDERWLTGADVTPDAVDTSPAALPTDPTRLPALNEYPDRLKALEASTPTEILAASPLAPCTTLYPMAEQFSVPGVMEITSAQPL